eukprot:CAMPEP_0182427688 /NCGR_PEP_ID=MMETSP1167-20130531/18985_1 /TAXON_ID=2988 /ORGANISM="Mallomonas Sp, Strain CCMP3275" /LENGTH=210 /DNA_ID=CAMNT_0024610111 /DNA_START=106 /DNA_END=738 /DNA_ORIENTATION=+
MTVWIGVDGFENQKRFASTVSPKQVEINNAVSLFRGILVGSTVFGLLPSMKANAVKGGIKPSSITDAKAAVQKIKACLDGMVAMKEYASKKEFQKIADMLSKEPYTSFEQSATTVVRSENLSQEDKEALGTIKRYGVVADVIIMIGGVGAALKEGGYKVGSGGSANGIDDEEENESEVPPVDEYELKKNIKLATDSLADVYRIISPLLNL